MINVDNMNKLLREVSDLNRERSTAIADKNRILTQIGAATLAGEDVALEMLRSKFNDADFTIRWSEQRLVEVKEEMTKMIDSIRFFDQ